MESETAHLWLNEKMKTPSRREKYKIPTSQNLANVALYYLSRYVASEGALRRVLENRLRRAALHDPEFARDSPAQNSLHAAIDAIVAKHKKTGALDDRVYAEMKTASWRRAGKSARAIKMRLGQSGIAAETIRQALTQDMDEPGAEEAELKAATALARRRKWGPFRTGKDDPGRRRKEFAAFARAGFSVDVVRKVLNIGAEDIEGFGMQNLGCED